MINLGNTLIVKKITLLMVILFIFSPSIWADSKTNHDPTLAVFYTRPATDAYYSLVNSFSRHVANSLGIKINAYYVDSNHLEMVNQIKKVASSNNKPDAIAFINFKRNDKTILKITDLYKIPTFIFNSNSTDLAPHYNTLVSVVSPDDEKAGFDLANYLFDSAPRDKNKIFVLGIEGDSVSSASRLRKQGLLKAVKKNKDVILQQIVSGDWSEEVVTFQMPILLKRYPQTKVIWTASDNMAIAVSNYLGANTNNIITGGIDWSNEGIEAVKNNKIIATYGNQFMELGWVCVLVYDLLSSKHSIKIPRKINLSMMLINKKNSDDMQFYTDKNCWKKTDFKKYSKVLNPDISSYSFVLNIDKCLRKP